MVCLLLASKVHDKKQPSVEQLCEMTAGVHTQHEFQQLELEIVERLDWLLHVPLPTTFFALLLRVVNQLSSGSETVPLHMAPKFGCTLINLIAIGMPRHLTRAAHDLALASNFTSASDIQSHHHPCLTELEFLKHPPLVVACGAVLATAQRECSPIYHHVIEILKTVALECNFTIDEVGSCAQRMLTMYCDYRANTAQSKREVFSPIAFDTGSKLVADRNQSITPTSIMGDVHASQKPH